MPCRAWQLGQYALLRSLIGIQIFLSWGSEAECFVLLKPTAAGQGWLGRQPKPLRACQCKSNAPYAILDGFLAHVR